MDGFSIGPYDDSNLLIGFLDVTPVLTETVFLGNGGNRVVYHSAAPLGLDASLFHSHLCMFAENQLHGHFKIINSHK